MKKRLAVLILTYNESEKIEDCIKSVYFADEIIIIDSKSTDNTCEIAERLGAKVYIKAMDKGFAEQRNYALTKTDAEWILYLDADERLTPDASSEIQKIVAKGDRYGYKIKRMNILFGQLQKYGGHAPDFVLRLYPRDSVHWAGIVHEHPELTVPIKKMKYAMKHYTYTNWEQYFSKFNHYTTLMAQKMKEKGRTASFLDIVVRPLYAFISFYILKSGWRDGKLGFVFALLHGFYTLVKYLKLYYYEKCEGKDESYNYGVHDR